MFDSLKGMRTFLVVAAFAAVVEGGLVYKELPSSERKYCASMELGDLLRVASQAEAELRAARLQMAKGVDENLAKEILRLEAASGKALNDVAKHKQQMQLGAAEAPCR